MIRRPPRSTQSRSSAASDVYKRQALYGPYPSLVIRLAFWIALAIVACVTLLQSARRELLRNTARFAIAFSAGALYLQLLALLNPSKPLVDALFHAHRFEYVLAGRFYFTQLSTSATPFPYAIGLYLSLIHISEPTRLGMISYAV